MAVSNRAKHSLDDLAETMLERRKYLQELLDLAKSRPRIPRDLKLAVFALSAELVAEAIEQADVAMRVNKDLVQAYQALQEEHRQVVIQNRALLLAMMDRKFFHHQASAH